MLGSDQHLSFKYFSILLNVFWNFDIFGNNFGINHKIMKYLKEICVLGSDQHLSFKYFSILLNVFWNFDIFGNNFGINHKIMKYLKEICVLGSDQHYSFKYFPKNSKFSPRYYQNSQERVNPYAAGG